MALKLILPFNLMMAIQKIFSHLLIMSAQKMAEHMKLGAKTAMTRVFNDYARKGLLLKRKR